jgi:hypothetical protein
MFNVSDEVKVDLLGQSMPQIIGALNSCSVGELGADDIIDFLALCMAAMLDNDSQLVTPRDLRLGSEVVAKRIEHRARELRTLRRPGEKSMLAAILEAPPQTDQ